MDMLGPEPDVKDDTGGRAAEDPYLKGFAKLGDQIFYNASQTSDAASESDDASFPDLIILCSWLYALPKHISKYTNAYQRIYPSTPILLLKQDGPDLMWRPNKWQMENLKPAVSVVRVLEQERNSRPRTLVHVFSNGGSFTACQLADAYALSVRAENKDSGWLTGPITLLPISALIIDSAPSITNMRSGFIALSQGLPSSLPAPVRTIGGVLMYTFRVSTSMAGKMLGVEGAITGMRRKLNDAHGAFMVDGVLRLYIYSETDELVPWQHVEMHAREARSVLEKRSNGAGTLQVKLEKFVGSRHVGHVVVDARRYWRVVKTHWAEV